MERESDPSCAPNPCASQMHNELEPIYPHGTCVPLDEQRGCAMKSKNGSPLFFIIYLIHCLSGPSVRATPSFPTSHRRLASNMRPERTKRHTTLACICVVLAVANCRYDHCDGLAFVRLLNQKLLAPNLTTAQTCCQDANSYC